MLHPDLIKHGREFARAIANKHYEVSDAGILFPKQGGAFVAGQFDSWINGRDHQVDHNKVPTEQLNYLLLTGYKSGAAYAAWYIAPFTTNVAPGATLTAATFTATQGEFILYNEATRQQWVLPANPTSGSFDNTAANAVFTTATGAGAGVAVYGAGILSASAKSATTGAILAASLFAAPRTVLPTDLLSIAYTVAATST